jgi:16S rRNA processing protein RimM
VTEATPDHGFILIAEVNRPRGLKGEVVVTVHADGPERMARLATVFLKEGGGYREVAVEGYKKLGDRAVLTLSGCASVEQARALVGCEMFIRAEDSTPAPEGRYYAHQLLGLTARLKDGRVIGTVEELLRQGSQTLLVVRGASGEVLVPVVGSICVAFDMEKRCVTLDPPEGLLELNARGHHQKERKE